MQSRFDCQTLNAEGTKGNTYAEAAKHFNAFRSKAQADCDQIPSEQTMLDLHHATIMFMVHCPSISRIQVSDFEDFIPSP